MFTKSLFKMSLIPAAALVIVAAAAPDASAGQRQRNLWWQNSNGTTGQSSGTVNRTRNHADGTMTGSTSTGRG